MADYSFSCTSCGVYNCITREAEFPKACPTTNSDEVFFEEALDAYKKEELVSRIARASAEVEGQFYGKLTRVEEIIEFAKKLGAKKIGIATCAGLIQESKIFAKILKARGLEFYSVICKVGGVDKTEIGIPEEDKVRKGGHESLCNPLLQAKILNAEQTDLNVVVGLCVGHDSLFMKYSDAPVTTLVTKDRVMGHNPVAALYTTGSYYAKLLRTE
ncbi:DUF1847 domain-containing protein [Paenibacillus zanthoxyli]|uniref:DUF1847 domain-containing protein n=1 Tax=Paenibacillus zanthoxyli TaxID=369399 RepID=UPI00046F2765|nr:DUF1847 domain-containing protein [Paenibacillus zanthoxyli]